MYNEVLNSKSLALSLKGPTLEPAKSKAQRKRERKESEKVQKENHKRKHEMKKLQKIRNAGKPKAPAKSGYRNPRMKKAQGADNANLMRMGNSKLADRAMGDGDGLQQIKVEQDPAAIRPADVAISANIHPARVAFLLAPDSDQQSGHAHVGQPIFKKSMSLAVNQAPSNSDQVWQILGKRVPELTDSRQPPPFPTCR